MKVLCKVFGHKWSEELDRVYATKITPGVFYLGGDGPFILKSITLCKRCNKVKP